MRVLEPRDAVFMLPLVSGEDWIRNIGDRGVRTMADSEAHIERIRAGQIQHGYSFYGVFLKETGEGIGICGLTKRPDLECADVGFAVLPKYYRKGYTLEAAQAVLEYAKNQLGLTEICAITAPENSASIAVVEKLGLKFERILKRDYDGVTLDSSYFWKSLK